MPANRKRNCIITNECKVNKNWKNKEFIILYKNFLASIVPSHTVDYILYFCSIDTIYMSYAYRF